VKPVKASLDIRGFPLFFGETFSRFLRERSAVSAKTGSAITAASSTGSEGKKKAVRNIGLLLFFSVGYWCWFGLGTDYVAQLLAGEAVTWGSASEDCD
jgi:hypothetical protein